MQPAVIHVDLDGAAEIYQAHGWEYPAAGDPLFDTGLRRALDFFDATKVRATFFVIARHLDDPVKRELLQEARRRGHEFASHTVTHRALTTLTSDEKRREIFESRDRIEAVLGTAPAGFRAPGFHMDAESLALLADAGYRYDSSMFPGAKVPQCPHRPFDGRALLELSMPGCAPLPLPFHPCYSLILGMGYYRLALRRFLGRNAPLVFLFHLTDFADPLPDSYLAGWRSRFYTLSHLSGEHKRERCSRMLNAVRQSFRIVTTQELLANYL
jgi:peptidoglycan/xylan/chitin deacetylase (PgdA/CDA1 family)